MECIFIIFWSIETNETKIILFHIYIFGYYILYILYIRSVIIFRFLNASLCNVYVLFSVLLWSRVIRCFHNIAFLRNYVFVFFPRSTCFDRLRQASTGFDKFRQATRASLLLPSPFAPRKFVNRNCVTLWCIHIRIRNFTFSCDLFVA